MEELGVEEEQIEISSWKSHSSDRIALCLRHNILDIQTKKYKNYLTWSVHHYND